MEEQNENLTNQDAQKTEETIAKKVFDDTIASYQNKIDTLEKENKTLTKQVNDYSHILRNFNVSNFTTEPQKSSDDLVKILMGGAK